MREKLIGFLRGRYGIDEFSKFLMMMGFALIILSSLTGRSAVNLLGFLAMGFAYYRVLSKDYHKCSMQNRKYLQLRNRLSGSLQGQIRRFKERKIYRFYSCPECRQKVRIPKGRGKVKITCPKCAAEFSEIS